MTDCCAQKTVDLKAREKAAEELQEQLMVTEQGLQSLAAEQRLLITDARQQASTAHLGRSVSNFAKHSKARSDRALAAEVFGCWSGAVKLRLETAMVEAMELLQAQVSVFEQELTISNAQLKELRPHVSAESAGSLESESFLLDSSSALAVAESYERKLAGMSGMFTGKQRDALLTQATKDEESHRFSDKDAINLTCLEVPEPRIDAEELLLAKRRCENFEISIAELEEERGRLLAQNAELSEQCKVMRAKLAEITEEPPKSESNSSTLLELEALCTESQQQALQSSQQCANLQKELFDVQEVASARQQLVADLQHQVKQIKKEKERLRADNESRFTAQELKRLELERGHVAQMAALRDEASPLQYTVMIEKQKRAEADAKLAVISSERDNLEIAVSEARRNIEELTHQLEYMRKAADGAEEEIEQEISRLREARTVEMQRNYALEAQLLVLKKQLQDELLAREEAMAASTAASDGLRAQISSLRSAMTNADKAALTKRSEMQTQIDRLTARAELLEEAEKVARKETRDAKDTLQAQIDYLRGEIHLKEEDAATKRGELLAQIDSMCLHSQRKDEAAAKEMIRLQEAAAAAVAEAVASAEKKQFERENVLVEVGEEQKRAQREEARVNIERLQTSWLDEKKVCAGQGVGVCRLFDVFMLREFWWSSADLKAWQIIAARMAEVEAQINVMKAEKEAFEMTMTQVRFANVLEN